MLKTSYLSRSASVARLRRPPRRLQPPAGASGPGRRRLNSHSESESAGQGPSDAQAVHFFTMSHSRYSKLKQFLLFFHKGEGEFKIHFFTMLQSFLSANLLLCSGPPHPYPLTSVVKNPEVPSSRLPPVCGSPGSALVLWQLTPWLIKINWLGTPPNTI